MVGRIWVAAEYSAWGKPSAAVGNKERAKGPDDQRQNVPRLAHTGDPFGGAPVARPPVRKTAETTGQ